MVSHTPLPLEGSPDHDHFVSLCSGLLLIPLNIFSLLPQMKKKKKPFFNEVAMLAVSVINPLANIWSTNGPLSRGLASPNQIKLLIWLSWGTGHLFTSAGFCHPYSLGSRVYLFIYFSTCSNKLSILICLGKCLSQSRLLCLSPLLPKNYASSSSSFLLGTPSYGGETPLH